MCVCVCVTFTISFNNTFGSIKLIYGLFFSKIPWIACLFTNR